MADEKSTTGKTASSGGSKATGEGGAEAPQSTDPTKGTDAVLVDVDDENGLDKVLKDADQSEFVRVEKDVVEQFYYPDTKRPAYRVLHHAGEVVSRAAVEQRAASIRAAKAAASDDPAKAAAARIDATTLHAGTYPGVEGLKSS